MLPRLSLLLHPNELVSTRKDTPENSFYCFAPSHMWTADYFNEKECWPVVIKTHPGRYILSVKVTTLLIDPPYGERGTVTLTSVTPTYCLKEPMELG
ncbi:hypothetical protein TNCV_202481 [Trichonephila clavipes]|nr:hypothetical protein TNCV_202481 [Trichonephila clavipes]